MSLPTSLREHGFCRGPAGFAACQGQLAHSLDSPPRALGQRLRASLFQQQARSAPLQFCVFILLSLPVLLAPHLRVRCEFRLRRVARVRVWCFTRSVQGFARALGQRRKGGSSSLWGRATAETCVSRQPCVVAHASGSLSPRSHAHEASWACTLSPQVREASHWSENKDRATSLPRGFRP